MQKERLNWFREATREELLDQWRKAPLEDPLVSGVNGRILKRILFPKTPQRNTRRAMY